MLKKMLFASVMAISLQSQAATSTLPKELTYAGKPIDALCFFIMEANATSINLKKCGLSKEKYKIKSINPNLKQKGFIGFDWQDMNPDTYAQGYSYYRYFPAQKNSYWIYSINNGGGSGDFTYIYLVSRNNKNTLSIKFIAGGDRCNGGLSNVNADSKGLNYQVNLTAYDVIALNPEVAKVVRAYDDLAACAACCVAKANYEVTSTANSILTSVTLNPIVNASDLPDQGIKQTCFDNIFMSHLKSGHATLSPQEVAQFAKRFEKECII